jgi:hypothetical protein
MEGYPPNDLTVSAVCSGRVDGNENVTSKTKLEENVDRLRWIGERKLDLRSCPRTRVLHQGTKKDDPVAREVQVVWGIVKLSKAFVHREKIAVVVEKNDSVRNGLDEHPQRFGARLRQCGPVSHDTRLPVFFGDDWSTTLARIGGNAPLYSTGKS